MYRKYRTDRARESKDFALSGFSMLPWLLIGLGAFSNLFQPETPNPVIGGLGLLAFNSLYIYVVFRAFLRETREATSTRVALALLTLITCALALGYGGTWLLFFPLLGLATGAAIRMPHLRWASLALTALAGTVGVVREGWDSLDTTYATWISTLVTAAVLSLTDTVRELRSAREELARRAVEKERLRFSRDLHDLLGHTLSVIVVKSEAARRLAPRNLDAALVQITDIESVGRQALTEIREAVTGYRESSFTTELDRSRSTLATAGITPTITESGPPLSPHTATLLGWVVREAVTNIVRHSGARNCAIELTGGSGRVRLTVTDDGLMPKQGGMVRVGGGLGGGGVSGVGGVAGAGGASGVSGFSGVSGASGTGGVSGTGSVTRASSASGVSGALEAGGVSGGGGRRLDGPGMSAPVTEALDQDLDALDPDGSTSAGAPGTAASATGTPSAADNSSTGSLTTSTPADAGAASAADGTSASADTGSPATGASATAGADSSTTGTPTGTSTGSPATGTSAAVSISSPTSAGTASAADGTLVTADTDSPTTGTPATTEPPAPTPSPLIGTPAQDTSPPDTPARGTGLIGLRERLAAVGGTLEAGPGARGGFTVTAELPAEAEDYDGTPRRDPVHGAGSVDGWHPEPCAPGVYTVRPAPDPRHTAPSSGPGPRLSP